MIFDWFKNRRRKGLLEEPFPGAWIGHLQNNVRHYAHLEPRLQDVLRQVVQVVVAEKHWAGAAGLSVSDEMKVTVAGQAALLVLGLDEPYFFDRVPSIILYPRGFTRAREMPEGSWTIFGNWRLSGEAWYRGPIVLSWDDVLACGRNAAQGRNVTLHEFAHHLDGLDGAVDGVPPLAADQEQKWYRVAEGEYLRLVGSAQRQEATLLDQYGATNRVEFFAVATECFFEQPHEMHRLHRELYEILRDFYRQDPAAWLPDAKGSRNRRLALREDQNLATGPVDDEVPDWYLRQLAPQGPEKLFLLGLEYLEQERNRSAAKVFTLVIEADRADAEAYRYRATARQRLGEHAAARADAEEAVRLDPDDPEAFRVRGAVLLGMGELQKAKKDLDRALAENNDAEAYYLRGLTLLGLDQLRPAVADLSWSITLRPHAAKAYYHRAHALRRLGDAERADADLEKALQLDPNIGWRQ
jgi:Mlc titration factor MtfA (ptsG expression regulator)/Tfp pilus assembly protein PilF